MFSALQTDSLAGPYRTLLRNTHEGILEVDFLAPGASPAEAPDRLILQLKRESGRSLGSVVLQLAQGTDASACEERIRPVLDCLVGSLAAVGDRRYNDLKLLKLANKLDLDFADDTRLDKAVAAVARRLGVAQRGSNKELDPGVRNEITRMRARVKPLTGKLRKPLVQKAECRLLLVPLFVGRERHNAWLVLANPLDAPRFGGWHMLAAMTLGQALAHRLENDLDSNARRPA
jgi:hypothetical protein